MKVKELIEILQEVSPNTEVRCGVGDTPTLIVTNLFNLIQ